MSRQDNDCFNSILDLQDGWKAFTESATDCSPRMNVRAGNKIRITSTGNTSLVELFSRQNALLLNLIISTGKETFSRTETRISTCELSQRTEIGAKGLLLLNFSP